MNSSTLRAAISQHKRRDFSTRELFGKRFCSETADRCPVRRTDHEVKKHKMICMRSAKFELRLNLALQNHFTICYTVEAYDRSIEIIFRLRVFTVWEVQNESKASIKEFDLQVENVLCKATYSAFCRHITVTFCSIE
jgi:hypothetical protein